MALLGDNSGIGAGAFSRGFKSMYFPMKQQQMQQADLQRRNERQQLMGQRYQQQLKMQQDQLASQGRREQASAQLMANPGLLGSIGQQGPFQPGMGLDAIPSAGAIQYAREQMTPKPAGSEFERLVEIRNTLAPSDPRIPIIDARLNKMSTSAPTTVINTGDIGAGDRPIVDKPSKDYQRVWSPETGTYTDQPIPGSAAATERETQAEKTEKSASLEWKNWEGTADNAMDSVDKALDYIEENPAATGYWANFNIKGSPAYNLEQLMLPIKSKVALGNLGALKKQSATGASGFGALSEKELALIMGTEGSFDTGLDPAILIDNLRAYKSLMEKVKSDPQAFGFNPGEMMQMKPSGSGTSKRKIYNPATGMVE
jgi:hypothetical protein